MIIRKLLFLILFVGLIGCTQTTSKNDSNLPNVRSFDTKDVAEISLTQDDTFRGSQNAEVTKIGDIATDEQGNVYFSDVFKNKIHVVDSSGLPIATMGRSGGRAGEFYKLGDIKVVGELVYGFDEERVAMNLYHTNEFEFRSTVTFSGQGLNNDSLQLNPYSAQVLSKNEFLVGFQQVNSPTDRQLYYFRTDNNAENYSEQLLTYPNKKLFIEEGSEGITIMMMPYERETLLQTDSAVNLYTLFTEDFLVKKFDREGNYLEAWHYPFEKRRLNKSDAIDIYTETDIRRAIRGDNAPNTWPAVAHYFIDKNNRHWVATITQNLENYTWYVLNADGQLKGNFELSRDFELLAVRDDQLYAKKFNPRTYAEEIIRFYVAW